MTISDNEYWETSLGRQLILWQWSQLMQMYTYKSYDKIQKLHNQLLQELSVKFLINNFEIYTQLDSLLANFTSST